MPVLDDLRNELSEITTLKYIAAAFTESSASKISKIRDAFEKNKAYYEEVSQLYHIVKVSAGLQAKLEERQEEKKAMTIAVTSNHRFYGMLNINTMKTFVSETQDVDTARFVIGQTGKDYLQTINYKHKFDSIEMKKDFPNEDEIKRIIEKTKDYTTVNLYYPKFKSMIRQTVELVDLTQTAEKKEFDNKKLIEQIFEPELSKIVMFFKEQIRIILLRRAMLEADLSRTAARLFAMSAAEDRADKQVQEKTGEISKVKSTIMNAQLLETFAGMKLWKQAD